MNAHAKLVLKHLQIEANKLRGKDYYRFMDLINKFKLFYFDQTNLELPLCEEEETDLPEGEEDVINPS